MKQNSEQRRLRRESRGSERRQRKRNAEGGSTMLRKLQNRRWKRKLKRKQCTPEVGSSILGGIVSGFIVIRL